MSQNNFNTGVQSLPFTLVSINDPFWSPRMEMNRKEAIYYQWDQLEKAGSIDNFRIVAGLKKGFRKGFFYSDSDVHKWAEAASNIYANHPDQKLGKLLDEYIDLIEAAQESDGYIFTYNQFHFGKQRWVNLLIEHELYTLGHFIEAGVAHYLATGSERMLKLSCISADLIINNFMNKPPEFVCGHEEIEIAMLRLFYVTLDTSYLKMADQFIERRGKIKHFACKLIKQARSQIKRSKIISKQRIAYFGEDKSKLGFDFSENLQKKEPHLIKLRSAISFMSGKYFQENKAVRRMTIPVGHSVRWGYFAASVAMLGRVKKDYSLVQPMNTAWENMVKKRMYVTGGIGSLPVIEGFGQDYELNNEYSYSETCAAIGCIFWNNEMLQATQNAAFADLTEWQLYNAASVGIALNGKSYLYRNPLESYKTLVRKPWFETSCCPSNISRLWASVGKYIYMHDSGHVWVNQYIGNESELFLTEKDTLGISIISGFPWEGKVLIKLNMKKQKEFTVYLRIPSWTKNPVISVNNEPIELKDNKPETHPTASGYNPAQAYYFPIKRLWKDGDNVQIDFPMHVTFREADNKVKPDRGKVAVTKGPLVYCLEGIDNQNSDMHHVCLVKDIKAEIKYNPALLSGINTIEMEGVDGKKLVFIPYYCWANRDRSDMKVWVKRGK